MVIVQKSPKHPETGNWATWLFGRKGRIALVSLISIALIWWKFASTPASGKVFLIYHANTFLGLLITSYLLFWIVYVALSAQPLGKRFARFSLTTCTMIFLLFIIELPALLGIIDYRLLISPSESALFTRIKPWQNPRNIIDPELLHIHRPGDHFVGETAGDLVGWFGIPSGHRYQVDVKYDCRGFRNPHDIELAPLVLIGDSFIEAGLVPQNQVVSVQMGRTLDVEVANLGQSGYGPQQELIVLRRYGLPLKPQVVVWFFFEGNDLLDVERYRNAMQNWDATIREYHGPRQRSLTANALLLLSDLTSPTPKQPTAEGLRRRGQFLSTSDSKSTALYFAYAAQPLNDADLKNLMVAQQCMLQARDLAVSNQASFVLAFIPTKFRVYHDFCEFPADSHCREWRLNDLNVRLGEWSREHGIPFVDLTDSLRRAAAGGEVVYFPDDGHWNGAGHRVVADAIAEFVQDKHLVKPSER